PQGCRDRPPVPSAHSRRAPAMHDLEHGMKGHGAAADPPPLADIYERWFESALADTPEQRSQAFRLRYQVYCVENPFEDPAEHPDGEERDAYDAHSAHALLVHRPSGAVAGTVRLVLARPDRPDDSFALQRVCHEPL